MVNYDDENWYRIINFLNSSSFDSIPPLNRVLLIESAARLAWIGQLDYKIFFDLIKYVAKDVDIQPGYTVISRIYDLNALLKRIPVHGRFVEYVKTLYRYGTRLHLDAQEEMPNFRMSGKVCKHDMEDCLEEIIHPQRASAMSNTITS